MPTTAAVGDMSQTEVSGPALGARMRQDALRIPLVTTHSGDQPTPNPTDRLVTSHNQARRGSERGRFGPGLVRAVCRGARLCARSTRTDCAVGSGQWAEPPHSPTTVHRRGSKSRNFWRLLGPRRQGPGGGPGGARRPGPDDPPGPLVTRRSPRGAVGGRLGPIPEGGPVPPGREPSSGRRPGGASGG